MKSQQDLNIRQNGGNVPHNQQSRLTCLINQAMLERDCNNINNIEVTAIVVMKNTVLDVKPRRLPLR